MADSITEKLLLRDESALSDIESKHGNLLRALAFRTTGVKEDAEEIINDVLLEIWETVPPKIPESILSYACMLTRRTAIDRVRYNTAEKRGGGEYPIAIEELSEILADGEEYEEGVITEAINSFLGTLKKKDRIIFMCRYFGFESPADIARKMSVTKNTVDIRLSRIRKELKEYLKQRGITI